MGGGRGHIFFVTAEGRECEERFPASVEVRVGVVAPVVTSTVKGVLSERKVRARVLVLALVGVRGGLRVNVTHV